MAGIRMTKWECGRLVNALYDGQVLRKGFQRQRTAAVLELALMNPAQLL